MTARVRRRTAALLLGLLLAVVTGTTAHSQVAPVVPPPMAAPIGGAPMPVNPGVPVPPAVPDASAGMPPPMATPGGFGSVGDFSSELQIQDLIRANGGPSLQPLSVSDYRLRPETTPRRSTSFRLQDNAEASSRFRLMAAAPDRAEEEKTRAAPQADQQRLAWPAVVSNCLDAPAPGSASACPG